MADLLNFTLRADGKDYASDDPLTLGDRVVRAAQGIVQEQIQRTTLRDALTLLQDLDRLLKQALADHRPLQRLGIEVVDTLLMALTPTPETAKALEAESREAILKEADDAIYDRRKSAVERERTIKEAELQTDMVVQTKQQAIAAAQVDNERALTRKRAEAAAEQLAGARGIAGHSTTLEELEGRGFAWDAAMLMYTVREPFPSQKSGTALVMGVVDEHHPLAVE